MYASNQLKDSVATEEDTQRKNHSWFLLSLKTCQKTGTPVCADSLMNVFLKVKRT